MVIIVKVEIKGFDNQLAVAIPYNKVLIDSVRSVPGRIWDSKRKFWLIPDTCENGEKLLEAIYSTGLFNKDNVDQDLSPLARMKRELQIAGYGRNTIAVYTSQVEHFFNRTGLNAESVQREDIILYLERLQKTMGLSRSSAVHIITGLKHFYTKGLRRKGAGPADTIPLPRKSRKYPDILSVNEVFRIINAPSNLKHKFLLNLIYSCGLRVGEAVTLKYTDIDFSRNLIHIRAGKGRKDRYVMLASRVVTLFKQYNSDFIVRQWLIPGPYTRLPPFCPARPRRCLTMPAKNVK